METKVFKFKFDAIYVEGKKFICLNDLLLDLYRASNDGFEILLVKDLIKGLENLKNLED